MEDCGQETPLSFMLRTNSVNEDWIIAHLNQLEEADFDLLARAPKFHIVHCPRSHSFFGHAAFALSRLRTLGFNICLGTDSLASNSSLSLFAEMRELLRKETGLAPRSALEMVTIHAAAALNKESLLGQISPGFHADLIAIPFDAARGDLFERIVAFDQTVPWTMVNGQVTSAA